MSAVQKSHDQQSVRPRRSASRVLAVCSLLALGCGGSPGCGPRDGSRTGPWASPRTLRSAKKFASSLPYNRS